MRFTRYPWHIWRAGGCLCFRDAEHEQDAGEAIIVPEPAVLAFLQAWLGRWPTHMTAEGILNRIKAGELEPDVQIQRHGPR
jgi:hypothetical protein